MFDYIIHNCYCDGVQTTNFCYLKWILIKSIGASQFLLINFLAPSLLSTVPLEDTGRNITSFQLPFNCLSANLTEQKISVFILNHLILRIFRLKKNDSLFRNKIVSFQHGDSLHGVICYFVVKSNAAVTPLLRLGNDHHRTTPLMIWRT